MRRGMAGPAMSVVARLILPVLVPIALLMATAPAGRAQGILGGSGASGGIGTTRPQLPPTPNLPSARRDIAPGLPGARSDEAMVTPADRPAMQMRPTEALFDAINRGDIAASRDAVGREIGRASCRERV